MKILTDDDVGRRADRRSRSAAASCARKSCVHTHFNHPREITGITERAMRPAVRGGRHRAQPGVLLRGVNDDPDAMQLLVKRLCYINVQPYYVYQHDLVHGRRRPAHHARAPTIEIEKQVRGATAGFNTPTFVRRRSGRRRQARRALVRALRPHHRRERVPLAQRGRERRCICTSTRSTSCRKKAKSAGPIRTSTRRSSATP